MNHSSEFTALRYMITDRNNTSIVHEACAEIPKSAIGRFRLAIEILNTVYQDMINNPAEIQELQKAIDTHTK